MKHRSIAILVIAFVLALGMFAQGALAAGATDESYIQCAKTLVEKRLLASSTAVYSDSQVVERDAYGRVLVTLAVDVQNTFGTPIRSYYAIVINSYNASTEEFDYYTTNGIQEFRDTSYRDTYIEFAKTGSYWGLPLKTSVYAEGAGELDRLNYNIANDLYHRQEYASAAAAFDALGNYEDATAMAENSRTALVEQTYNDAISLYNERNYTDALALFEGLTGYKDSLEWTEKSRQGITQLEYEAALHLFDNAQYEEAKEAFIALGDYSDAAEWRIKCEKQINQKALEAAIALYEAGDYAAAKEQFLLLGGYLDATEWATKADDAIKQQKYEAALVQYNAGEYEAAKLVLSVLGDYKDAAILAANCDGLAQQRDYMHAVEALQGGEYDEAVRIFGALGGYLDARALRQQAMYAKSYAEAMALYDAGDYLGARSAFRLISEYSDAAEWAEKCSEALTLAQYTEATELYYAGDYEQAKSAFVALEGYSDAADWITRCEGALSQQSYNQAMLLYDDGSFAEAREAFLALGAFSDAASYVDKCSEGIYQQGISLYNAGSFEEAKATFVSLGDYKDAGEWSAKCDEGDVQALYQRGLDLYQNRCFFQAYEIFSQMDGLSKEFMDAFMLAWRTSNQRKAIAAYGDTVVAIGENGQGLVWSFGEENLYDAVSRWTNLVSIDISENLVVGLRADGTVVNTSRDITASITDTSSWKNIVSISAGDNQIVALTSYGKVLFTKRLMDTRVVEELDSVVGIKSTEDFAVIDYILAFRANGTISLRDSDGEIDDEFASDGNVVRLFPDANLFMDAHGRIYDYNGELDDYLSPTKYVSEISMRHYYDALAILTEDGHLYRMSNYALSEVPDDDLIGGKVVEITHVLINKEEYEYKPIVVYENGFVEVLNDSKATEELDWKIKTPAEVNKPLPDLSKIALSDNTTTNPEENFVATAQTYYVVNCNEYVSLRSYPDTSAKALTLISLGEPVTFLREAEDGFYLIEYNGMEGYVLSSYLATSRENPNKQNSAPYRENAYGGGEYDDYEYDSYDYNDSSEYDSYDEYDDAVGSNTCYIVNCNDFVSLRSYPSTTAPRLARVPLGARVEYLSDAENEFWFVEYNGRQGFVLSSYVEWA